MTITEDFAQLAIKIRADMEHTLRVLEEQIILIDDSIAGTNFS